jgi:hypothetical protein
MYSSECPARVQFFESSLKLLEQESMSLKGSDNRDIIRLFIDGIHSCSNYPVNLLLEDFVEVSSLRTLEQIHKLMDRFEIVSDNPETTKMGVLKIFNLFSRRHYDGFGSENMARFMLLVARAVKISDRSGINLKGERNSAHIKTTGNSSRRSPLAKSIFELQAALYQTDQFLQPSGIVKLISELISLIAPSLVESDDLLSEVSRLQSAPCFLIDESCSVVDVNSAIILLIQCFILIDSMEDEDKKLRDQSRHIISMLKKTTVGRKIIKLLPIISTSDHIWRKWKRDQQCKDLSNVSTTFETNPAYFSSFKNSFSFDFEEFEPKMNFYTPANLSESVWASARRKAFA